MVKQDLKEQEFPLAPQKIEVFDKDTNITTCYDSMSETTKALNLSSPKIISQYISRNQIKPYKNRDIFTKV